MTALAYYNEFDDETASWLEDNIRRGLVAPGHVDRRDIRDVQPHDLKGYAQHHFFAGIGGWSLAARMAGWVDSRPLWSASLPCQPFSTAGLRQGADDPRHCGPDFCRLVDAARPPCIVGEQVSGQAGYDWFDGISSALEASRFLSRTVDIPACAVDSPQQRNRLYWVAVAAELLNLADDQGQRGGAGFRDQGQAGHGRGEPSNGHGGDRARAMGRPVVEGLERHAGDGNREAGREPGPGRSAPAPNDSDGPMGVGAGERRGEGLDQSAIQRRRGAATGSDGADGPQAMDLSGGLGRGARWRDHAWHVGDEPLSGDQLGREGRAAARDMAERHIALFRGIPSAGELGVHEYHARADHGRNGSWWQGAEWIVCHDEKARRVPDARAPLLVTGFPNRILAWRGFGNAIVPPLAAEAIAALSDILPPWEIIGPLWEELRAAA